MSQKSLRYIVVCGLGWSGSSALIDCLREFRKTFVPEEEFRIIKEPYGIIDLDRSLNDSIDLLNEDIAIRNFKELCEIYYRIGGRFKPFGFNMKKDFGDDFLKITYNYIDELVNDWYRSHWWFITMRDSRFLVALWALLRRFHIYNRYEHYKMALYTKTEEEFLEITKRYIDNIFINLTKGTDLENIVLDQAIPVYRPEFAKRYIRNAKMIIVDRDPRDQYVDLINSKMLIGPEVKKSHNVDLFKKWFLRYHEHLSELKDVLYLHFEDLVMKYDETVKIVCDYAGLNMNDHVNPKMYFNPAVSIKNIGLWKSYNYQEDIREIENKLPEFIRK